MKYSFYVVLFSSVLFSGCGGTPVKYRSAQPVERIVIAGQSMQCGSQSLRVGGYGFLGGNIGAIVTAPYSVQGATLWAIFGIVSLGAGVTKAADHFEDAADTLNGKDIIGCVER